MNILYKLFRSIPALAVVLVLMLQVACKKMVEIDPPNTSITTAQTFADSTDASSAIQGLYAKMINTGGSLTMGNGALTVYCGASADELLPFLSQGDQLANNTLNPDNGKVYSFWSNAYTSIYAANASIEGLQGSTGITPNAKKLMTGEARFFRAFYYFYLVNLFGDCPLATSSDYRVNAIMARTPKAQIYDTIVADLKFAESALPTDYSYSGGERTRVNSSAASAMLARVYLYLGRWDDALKEATTVVDNAGQFSLANDLKQVFLANSSEAILQLRPNTAFNPYNSLPEAYNLIPTNNKSQPFYYLTNMLKAAFETDDKRRKSWIDSTTYAGKIYLYPSKYKIGKSQRAANATPTEYYSMLRLAELYLIRAEAEIQLNQLTEAAVDINAIRNRAGLANTSASSKEELTAAVAHERQIEFFAEWGHRWLDLKRTGQIDSVMTAEKSNWRSYQQLYPIAYSEQKVNPNLSQNPGY